MSRLLMDIAGVEVCDLDKAATGILEDDCPHIAVEEVEPHMVAV